MSNYVGAETLIIDDWLEQQLGNAEGAVTALANLGVTGVFNHFCPNPLQEYPFIVYQMQSATDVRGQGTETWMVDCVYIVKLIAQISSYQPLQEIMVAMNPLIDNTTEFPFAGGFITGARRLRQFRFIEVEDGSQIRHLGGEYRIQAEAI